MTAGLAMLGLVVMLGVGSARNSIYVPWFGIASAVLAPLALNSFGQALRSDDRLLMRRLLKIPQIDRLVHEAESQEEKIRRLETERARVTELIRVESRRQTLVAESERLERLGASTLAEYQAVGAELAAIGVEIEESPALQEMRRIQDRISARTKGRVLVVRLFGRELTFIESEFSNALPDTLLLLWLRSLEARQIRELASASESRS